MVAVAFAALSVEARGHAGGFDAFVTLTPDRPKPGQIASVKVELRDPYNAAIPATQADIAVGSDGDTFSSPVALHLISQGTFSGEVNLPQGPQVYLLVRARMQEFHWLGRFRVVYDEQVPVTHVDVPLLFSSAPSPSDPASSDTAPALTARQAPPLPSQSAPPHRFRSWTAWAANPWALGGTIVLTAVGILLVVAGYKRVRGSGS